MKKINRFILFASVIAPITAHAGIVEIFDYGFVQSDPGIGVSDFESGSTGIIEPPEYNFQGYPGAGWHGNGTLANSGPDFQTIFGVQYLGNTSGPSGHSDIVVIFNEPMNFAGAWLMSAFTDVQNITFSAFGTDGGLLFERNLIAPSYFDEIYFYGIYSTETISRVVWHDVEDGFFRLDNLSYGNIASPVPVPVTAWLFSSGLLGLVGVVRRKKAA